MINVHKNLGHFVFLCVREKYTEEEKCFYIYYNDLKVQYNAHK